MKKNYILTISSIILLSISTLGAQYALSAESGFFYSNYFDRGNKNHFTPWGWGLKSELSLSKKVFRLNHHGINIGLGYTNYSYLDERYLFIFETLDNESLSYLDITLDYEFDIIEKFRITAAISNEIFLHRIEISLLKRYNVTVDLGFSMALSNKLRMTINSPINVLPMFEGMVRYNFQGPIMDIYVENIGVLIGLKYEF